MFSGKILQMPLRRVTIWVVSLIVAVPLLAVAQRGFFGFQRGRYPNVVYDGRFTFVRAEYAQYGSWAADYPTWRRI